MRVVHFQNDFFKHFYTCVTFYELAHNHSGPIIGTLKSKRSEQSECDALQPTNDVADINGVIFSLLSFSLASLLFSQKGLW